MKTEQEIQKLAKSLFPHDAEVRLWYKMAYTQAQDDMQAEIAAKDAEIEKLKAELQAVKDDAIGFVERLEDENYYRAIGDEFYPISGLYQDYKQSKTQTK